LRTWCSTSRPRGRRRQAAEIYTRQGRVQCGRIRRSPRRAQLFLGLPPTRPPLPAAKTMMARADLALRLASAMAPQPPADDHHVIRHDQFLLCEIADDQIFHDRNKQPRITKVGIIARSDVRIERPVNFPSPADRAQDHCSRGRQARRPYSRGSANQNAASRNSTNGKKLPSFRLSETPWFMMTSGNGPRPVGRTD